MKQASNQTAVDALMRVPDAALLKMPGPDLVEQAYRVLGGIRFEGIALRAPLNVRQGPQEPAPALVAISQPGPRAAQAPPGDNAIFFVNALGRPGQWIAPVFPVDPNKIPRRTPPVPPGPDGPDEITTVRHADLLALEALPQQPGDYAVRVISYYLRSNTVVVRLLPEQGGVPLAAGAAGGDLAVTPNPAAPGAPPVWRGDGAALSIPATAAASAAIPVQGIVRLPAGSAPLASMVAHVLLARRGSLQPLVATVPVSLRQAADGQLEGQFSTDLVQQSGGKLVPDRYAVFLIAAQYTAGPYLMKVD